MAVPWATLFSAIPWSDVIAKAPEIAQGARKLWQKVGKRGTTPPVDVPADAPNVPAVDSRLAQLESRLAELTTRQQESAELLAELAEQNADLIRATEELRGRVRQLGIVAGVLATGLAAVIVLLFMRS